MPTEYEKQKKRTSARVNEISAEGRDIGPLPEVVKPKRKAKAAASFRFYCETYFPGIFYLDWSQDQLDLIAEIERTMRGHGLKAFALPRGSGKTCLSQVGALWGVSHGYKRFVPIAAATASKGQDLVDEIKIWCQTNDLLLEDYPEVVYPIRRLENITHRCKGQTLDGVPTRMEITAGKLTFPTVKDSACSGSLITGCGLTGGEIRGQKHTTAAGQVLRPDACIVDDPQTRESAHSPSQCDRREKIIKGDLLKMSGPDKRLSCLLPCTIIQPGDLAHRMLDRARNPEWYGVTCKMIVEWPKRMDLWEKYSEIRQADMQNDGTGEVASQYYRDHKSDMDECAVMAWPSRINEGDVSALQTAMNEFFLDPASFKAEYQNEPELDEHDDAQLSAEDLEDRHNGLIIGTAPNTATHVTMGVDVQGELLFYAIVAARDDFTPFILEYGTWPEQTKAGFTLSNASRTLSKLYPNMGQEARIQAALNDLSEAKLSKPLQNETGHPVDIDRAGFDANWAVSTDVVYSFCRASEYRRVVIPTHGRYYGASSKPFDEVARKPGDRTGPGWKIPGKPGERPVRHLIYDANRWKTFLRERLRQAVGDPGAMTFYGDKRQNHSGLIAHLLAERGVRTTANGRTVMEWKANPGKDNHWLDCIVIALALLSEQGCKLDAAKGGIGKRDRKKIKLSEIGKK